MDQAVEVDCIIHNCIKLVVSDSEIGRRVVRVVLLAHGAHQLLPQQHVLRRKLLTEHYAKIELDLDSKESDFVLPRGRSHSRLAIASIDSEELGEDQRSKG